MDSVNNSSKKPARKVSRSETGHIINAQNFKKLLDYLDGLGADYKPTNEHILLPYLQDVYTQLSKSMTDLGSQKTLEQDVENNRKLTFKPLKPLSTRIINALIASGVPALTVDDTRLLVDKIQGVKISKPPIEPELNEDGTEVATISASQQSYNQLMDHLKDLITLLSNQKKYKPVEKGLSLAELRDFNKQLVDANDQFVKQERLAKMALNERNRLLYKEETGIIDQSKVIKAYVLSMFYASHPSYLMVKAIPFKNLKDRKKKAK